MSKWFRILLRAFAVGAVVLIALGLLGQVIETGSDPAEFAVGAFRTIGVPGATAAYRANDGGSRIDALYTAAEGMPADGLFPIASVSKPITAVAVLQLVEDGVLSLDDTIADVLSLRAAGAGHLAGGVASVTVGQLLSHTSGISTRAGLVYTTKDVRADDFALLSTLELENEPGASYAYSNLNYRILGVIVEELTGRGFSEYLAKEIFEPQGMTQTTTAGGRGGADLVPGFTHISGIPVRFFWEAGLAEVASGGMLSTRSDMMSFAEALLAAYAGAAPAGANSPAVRRVGVNRDLVEQMWSPVVDVSESESWGLGWQVNEVDDVRVVSHGGDLPGYQAMLTIAPAQDRAMVVLANANTIPLAIAGEIIQETLRRWVASGQPPTDTVRLPRVRMAVIGLLMLLAVLMARDVARFIALLGNRVSSPRGAALILGLLGALAPAAVAGFITVQGILDDALVMLPDVTGVLLLFALFGSARGIAIVIKSRRGDATR